MRHLLKKLKTSVCLTLAATLVAPFGLAAPTMAAPLNTNLNNPANISNEAPQSLGNGVVIAKTVQAESGFANLWNVTLRVEAPQTSKKSDTVLVIDTSGSMKQKERMAKAKEAANHLIGQLLSGNGSATNRIAIVSFATDATINSGFTNNLNSLQSVVNSFQANGGTFTQAGVKTAASMLDTSSATHKNIILLSDGEPTFSYKLNNPDDYLIDYPGNGWQTSTAAPVAAYAYPQKVGDGDAMYYRYENHLGTSNDKYYNHGNSAIAEAGFFKQSGHGSLYTVALDPSTASEAVLQAMASPGKAYQSTSGDLDAIFQQIGGSINNAISNANVADQMGPGFIATQVFGNNASISSNQKTLHWTPSSADFVWNANIQKYVAQISYQAQLDAGILTATADAAGLYPINQIATINYHLDGSTAPSATFPVPKAKPTLVHITKVLKGQEWAAEQSFDVKVTEPAEIGSYAFDGVYQLTQDSGVTIYKPLLLGDGYSMAEVATHNNTVQLKQYDTSYTINGQTGQTFAIVEGQPTHATITNEYRTVKRSVEKIWDGKEGEEAVAELLANGVRVASLNLNATAGWKQDFAPQPLKDANGQEITYTVREDLTGLTHYSCGDIPAPDPNGLVQITNTYIPDKVNVKVKKTWQHGSSILNPQAVINLLRDGVKVNTVTFNRLSEVEEHTFSNLDKTDKWGHAYNYTVQEDISSLWTNIITQNTTATQGSESLSFEVTNIYQPPKTSVEANKVWSNGSHLVRPDIWFKLYRSVDGASTEAVPGLAAQKLTHGDTTANWEGLDKTDAEGRDYSFSVKETDADGNDWTPTNYTKSEDGLTVTNSYQIPQDVNINVAKIWSGGPINTRPNITINLLRQIEGGTAEVVTSANLTYPSTRLNFANLERTNLDGDAYTYSVAELAVPGYQIKYADLGNGNFEITNIYNVPIQPEIPNTTTTAQIKTPDTGTKATQGPASSAFTAPALLTTVVSLTVVYLFQRKRHSSKD